MQSADVQNQQGSFEPPSEDALSHQTMSLFDHMRASLALGIPLIAAQLVAIAIGVTDTLMLGWLGAEPLAAGVLGTQIVFITWLFGSGFGIAIMPLAANAFGSGDEKRVRRSVRMGLWAVMGFSFFALIFLSFSYDVFIALKQPEGIARVATNYVNIAMWSIIPILIYSCLRSFMTTLNFSGIVLWGTLAGAILNGLLNYMLIFGNWGAPRLEVEGAAIATLGTNILIALVFAGFVFFNQEAKKYTIFSRIWRPDWEALFEILRLGLPISIGILSEVSLFAFASIMMGWLGTIPLAAHGIVLQLASVTFMIPLALSNAVTVRVGTAFGRDNWLDIKRAAQAILIIVSVVTAFSTLLFIAIPQSLILLFLDLDNLDAGAVLHYAVGLIYIAAIFQLVDGLQVVVVGILRGLKDATFPMFLGVFSYWGIGVGSSYIMGFVFGWGGKGIWIGLAFGLLCAAVLLLIRFFSLLNKNK